MVMAPTIHAPICFDAAGMVRPGRHRQIRTWLVSLLAMGCLLRRGPPTIQAAIAPQPATMERGRNRRGVQPGRIGGLPTSIAPPAMHAAVEPHCAGVIRTHFNRLIGTRLACRPAVIHRFPAPAFHAAVHAQGTGMPRSVDTERNGPSVCRKLAPPPTLP